MSKNERFIKRKIILQRRNEYFALAESIVMLITQNEKLILYRDVLPVESSLPLAVFRLVRDGYTR